MEDIAKRLRAWAAYELHESDPAAVILLAAEEIERLRTQGNGLADRVGSLFRETQELYRHIATKQPWIPVSERLPEKGQRIIVWATDGKAAWIDVAEFEQTYKTTAWATTDEHSVPFTHWMPLPEPPEVK